MINLAGRRDSEKSTFVQMEQASQEGNKSDSNGEVDNFRQQSRI
jgi:hypothetical protein